jgi:diadenosine tetraphosphate (Ap4A) HIT family hydrolase
MLNPSEYDRLARSACFVCRVVEGTPLIGNPHIIFEDDDVIAFLNQFPTQEGYTLVCPKRHVERYELDLTETEWSHLQAVVRRVSRAIAEAMDAIRMYVAILGSPERNPHIHVHVCPCPQGTPFEKQQFAALLPPDGGDLEVTDQRMEEIATRIRERLDARPNPQISQR